MNDLISMTINYEEIVDRVLDRCLQGVHAYSNGFVVIESPAVPDGEMWFVKDGKLVGKIINIGTDKNK